MEAAPEGRPRPIVAGLVTAMLGLAAAAYLAYHAWLALGADDTYHLETPLALAVARQLTHGPGDLYGPFGGDDPLVLIHAPLGYRLAGLIAWPIARLGADPVAAALAGGRVLSMLGLALLAWAAGRLARLDGARRRAGLWAALLVLGAPVVAGQGVAVRADVPALACQTVGALLALAALRDGPGAGPGRLLGAYVAFALAFAMKQHAVASGGLMTLILLGACARGRVRPGACLAALGLGAAVVAAYFGLEEWLTSGRMHRAAFVLPAEIRRIAGSTWGQAAWIAWKAALLSAGPLALGLACLLAAPRAALGGRLDATLALFALAEAALAAALCRNSTGAWVNYFMPTIVYGCVLVARAIDRVLASPRASLLRLAPIGPALAVAAGADAYVAYQSYSNRAEFEADMATLLAQPAIASRPSGARYFEGSPNSNRMFGRASLAYDHWLYPVFEALGEAEPRDDWLRGALLRDVEVVVVPPAPAGEAPGSIPGLSEPLPALGYNLVGQVGASSLWERAPSPPPSRPAVPRMPD
jgi:hypothetical protein